MPTARFDDRYSQAEAGTPWPATEQVLLDAELYWLTTVRPDGRPHVCPLIGTWLDDAAWFTTGDEEQKARNLQHSGRVALTTGVNTWQEGLDVVVEGTAERVTAGAQLGRLAAAIREKYDGQWDFGVDEQGGTLLQGDHPSALYRVAPSKVLAFAKDPHAQTAYDFQPGS